MDRVEDLLAGELRVRQSGRGTLMAEIADRYRRAAGGFSQRVNEVPADGWDRPAPCEGWVARDVVRHLVEWVPAFWVAAGAATTAPAARRWMTIRPPRGRR